MIVIVMIVVNGPTIEIAEAGGIPNPALPGHPAAIGTVAAGNAVAHVCIRTLASVVVSSACAVVNSANPWATTETKSPQFGFSAAPALRSTMIVISVEQAPIWDTIDRTCATGE
jgi:hypothetical protein